MKIDKDIPMEAGSKYPWRKMEIGDSCYVEKESMNSTRNSAYWYGHRNPPFKIATRKEGKGFRLWRIK